VKAWRTLWPEAAARCTVSALVLSLSFAAPGIAAEGDPGGGIGGTGITGFGVVQKFGSIYVNGREYAIDPATRIVPDGKEGSGVLHRGDVVKVAGVIDASGRSAAVRVEKMLAVRGVVERIERRSGELVILGQRIRFDAATVYDEAGTSGAATPPIRVGDAVAVNGLAMADGSWTAVRIAREPPEEIHFLVRGAVTALDRGHALLRMGEREFALNGATVPAGVQVGDLVRLEGHYASGRARVDSVNRVAPLFGASDRLVEMSGYTRRIAATHEIACNGVVLRFDGESRFVSGSLADIRDDVPLAVRGKRQVDGSVLVREIQQGVEPMRVSLPEGITALEHGHGNAAGGGAAPESTPENRRGPETGAAEAETARPETHDQHEIIRPNIERPMPERPSVSRPSIERPDIDLPESH
jgi:Domain of unknown function (DUF5666)